MMVNYQTFLHSTNSFLRTFTAELGLRIHYMLKGEEGLKKLLKEGA